MQFISSLWKIWEKQGLSSLLNLKCSTSSCRYIQEIFKINQQIVYTMRSSVGHMTMVEFKNLINEKQVTVKTITKKFKKMIDAVNVVDINVYQYWDNKIRVCRALSKTSGNRLRNLKKKEKGWGGRCRLTNTIIDWLLHYKDLASNSSKCLEPAKCEINFLVSLFYVVSCEDSIYHYPHCPIGSDSLCKYNPGRANL